MTLPAYSVVIPCYNAERFIRETLDSALNQSHPPLEVIVVDDGSTDGSAVVAEAYGPPVRVMRQPNSGESVARNRGMDEARGEWIALLDSDDIWLPDKMRQELTLAAGSLEVVAVHSWFEYFGALEGMPQLPPAYETRRPSLAAVIREVRFHPSTLILRSSLQIRFDESTKMGEDTLFFLTLLSQFPAGVAFCPQPLVRYRKHAAQQTMVPGHFLKKLEGLARWAESDGGATVSDRREVRDAVAELGLSSLALYKARRDWPSYDAFRQFLSERLAVPAPVVREAVGRRFPSWVYRLWDQVR